MIDKLNNLLETAIKLSWLTILLLGVWGILTVVIPEWKASYDWKYEMTFKKFINQLKQ